MNLVTYLLIDHAPNATRPSERKLTWAVALLTSTAAIIRAEVALLLAPLALQLLYSRQLPLFKLLKVGILSGIISAGEFLSCHRCDSKGERTDNDLHRNVHTGRFLLLATVAYMAGIYWTLFQCRPRQELRVGSTS